ncbi:hypothetical protein JXA88_17110 [Candidatus Fermentibacteria bacterium]|nr:hypothetical protein [Candidatus Fermentibacteria bacterium]
MLGAWALVLVVAGSWAYAETQTLCPELPSTVFTHFDGHGLGSLNGCAFDSAGCAWFATSQGLLRFDGQRVRRFDTRDGLPDLHVYDIVCDAGGVLYAGTWRGLGVFRDGRFQTVPFHEAEGRTDLDGVLTHSPARRLALDKEGGLWATGDGGVLRRVEPGMTATSVVPSPLGLLHIPTHLALDRGGRVWLAHLQPATPPLVYCRTDTGFVPASAVGAPPDIVELGCNDAGLWLQTVDGTVWIEAEGGFLPDALRGEWPGRTRLFQWLTAGGTNVLLGESVIMRFTQEGRRGIAESPVSGRTRAAVDIEGMVWCPARPEGVVRVGPDAIEWFRLPEPLGITIVQVGPDGALWCGSESGLHHGRPVDGSLRWSHVPLPPVTVLQAVESESVMVGTVDGAFLVAGDPPRVMATWTVDRGLPNPVVTALEADARSGWIGTAQGTCRWAVDDLDACVAPELTMAITALLGDSLGAWIGTWGGLNRYRGGAVELVGRVDQGGILPAVTSLYKTPADEILVGTYSDGLFAIRGDTLSPLPSPLSRVVSIVPRPGDLPFVVGITRIVAMEPADSFALIASFDEPHPVRASVGMDDGLWLVTSTSLERWGSLPPIKLGAGSGLPDEPILTLSADRQGNLWASTEHYLCRVSRDRLGTQPLRGQPAVAVVQEGPSIIVSPGEKHRAPLGTRDIALEFRLPWDLGGMHELRTRLDPLQPSWTPWDNRWHREYGALPPGRQAVWVQARTADGRVSPETMAAVLVIPPRWHERASVRIAGGLLLVVLGVMAGLSRTAAARARASKLERMVSERTAELDAARSKAIEASTAKSLLLSRMSHELRTPLSAMMGFSDLIAESSEASEEHRGYAQVITDAGQRLLGLIRSILDLSKAEAAAGQCEHVPFEPKPLVADIVQLLSVEATEGGIDLAAEENGWPSRPMRGDPDRLREVLINLVRNALKYTERGGHVRIACRAGDSSIEISVKDTGPGISPEDQKRLFDPFVRLAGGKPGEGGAGLGLTITKQLVEAMGGTISVESTVGEGSTFAVALPVW